MNSGTVISTPPALASTPYPGLGYEYELECDIDFFKELKKMSAATNECDQPTSDTTMRCLITDDKLTKDHITLECGHKFNYVPLFKEVLFQKCSMLPKNLSAKLVTTYTKVGATNIGYQIMQSQQTPPPAVLSMTYNSSYNLETTKLQYNQIKCPYCRSITSSVLPYYPYPDVCKVKYVNTPTNLSLPSLSCEYHSFISREHGKPDDSTTCKLQCIYNAKYDLMLCNKHLNKLDSRSDGNSNGAGVSSGSGSSSPTRKLTRTTPPQTRSCVSKKQQDPPPLPNPETENVIISHHNPATAACTFTLLSGPRKGTPCGKPIWISKKNTVHDAVHAALCKVHYEKGIMI
jgi:hypothetical protein